MIQTHPNSDRHYRGVCANCGANVLVVGDNPNGIVAAGLNSSFFRLPRVVAFECPSCDTYN